VLQSGGPGSRHARGAAGVVWETRRSTGHVRICEMTQMRRGEQSVRQPCKDRGRAAGRTELHRLSSFSDALVACHGREDRPTYACHLPNCIGALLV
jgi:hypothetical protein